MVHIRYRQQFIPGISSNLVRLFRRSVFRCYQVGFLDALFSYATIIVYILSYSTKISLNYIWLTKSKEGHDKDNTICNSIHILDFIYFRRYQNITHYLKIEYFIKDISEAPITQSTLTARNYRRSGPARTTVRETSGSRHHGAPIEGPSETPSNITMVPRRA